MVYTVNLILSSYGTFTLTSNSRDNICHLLRTCKRVHVRAYAPTKNKKTKNMLSSSPMKICTYHVQTITYKHVYKTISIQLKWYKQYICILVCRRFNKLLRSNVLQTYHRIIIFNCFRYIRG